MCMCPLHRAAPFEQIFATYLNCREWPPQPHSTCREVLVALRVYPDSLPFTEIKEPTKTVLSGSTHFNKGPRIMEKAELWCESVQI